MLRTLHAGLTRAEQILEIGAGICLVLVMLIISADAVGRYAFARPLGWAIEVVTLYLLPAVFFLALPISFARHAHVAVDVLMQTTKSRLVRRLSNLLGYAAGTVFFGLLLVVMLARLTTSLREGEVSPGYLMWPVWPTNAVVCLGSLMAMLRTGVNSCLGETVPDHAPVVLPDALPPRGAVG